MSEERYFARSASDNTDDWPCWYVADRTQGSGNLNVTRRLEPSLAGYLPFISREKAIELARRANAGEVTPAY